LLLPADLAHLTRNSATRRFLGRSLIRSETRKRISDRFGNRGARSDVVRFSDDKPRLISAALLLH
jgi:hypothetical protein